MRRESATLAGLLAVAKAQSILIDGVLFAYQTATITECFPMGSGGLEPTPGLSIGGNAPVIHRPAVTGQPIIVEVEAPRCDSCGCDACAHTEVYTLTCDAFCHTGLCNQVYVVTETYSGMTAKPTLAPTDLPFGFTCDVQTCTTCGSEPITATITYPLTERLYINKVPAPTGVPAGSGPGGGVPGVKKPAAYSPSQEDGTGFHYESDYASGADPTSVSSNPGTDSDGSGSDANSKSNPNGGSNGDSGSGSNDNSHYGSDSDAYPNSNSDSRYKAGSNSSPEQGPGGSQPGPDAGSQPESYPGSQPGSQPGSGAGNNAAPNNKQNTGSGSASNSPELPPSDDRPVYVSSASKSIVILTLSFTSLVSFTFLALISL